MKTTKQLKEEIAAKSKKLHEVFEEAGPDRDFDKIKSLDGDTKSKLEQIETMTKELNDLHTEYEKSAALDKAAEDAQNINKAFNNQEGEKLDGKGAEDKPEKKSIGQLMAESDALKKKGDTSHIDVEVKTLMETSAGWAPESVRIDRVEQYPVRKLRTLDFIPIYPTSQAAVKYMEETTYTNNAAETSEGGTYGEAALAFTEQSKTVEKPAVWLPVTDEQLEDVEGITAYINNRLSYMINARLDGQVLEGDGSTPNLLGTLNVTGIQSQAKGADPVPDAIYKLFTLIRASGFGEPSVYFTNPNDWQDVRLLRTADGLYIFGNPTDPGPDRIWGVQVCQTTAVTENTGLAGDYINFGGLYMRRGIDVQVTNAHSDYFVKGKQAIRADMRCAMVHFRPEAFGKVTSI